MHRPTRYLLIAAAALLPAIALAQGLGLGLGLGLDDMRTTIVGPPAPPLVDTFVLLNAGGMITLNAGGSLLCNAC